MVLSALGLLAALAVVVLATAERRRTRAELRSCRAQIATLRARVDELALTSGQPGRHRHADHEDYVITALPVHAQPGSPADAGHVRVDAGFVSVAAGESMVRLVSLAHGVRRALSPESRNRIRFEMRREVKRARKQRRRDIRAAQLHLRTHPAPQRQDLDEEAA